MVENFKYCLSAPSVNGRLLLTNFMESSNYLLLLCRFKRDVLSILVVLGNISLNVFCANENLHSKTNKKSVLSKTIAKEETYKSKELLPIKKSLIDNNRIDWDFTFFNILSGRKQVRRNLCNIKAILFALYLFRMRFYIFAGLKRKIILKENASLVSQVSFLLSSLDSCKYLACAKCYLFMGIFTLL